MIRTYFDRNALQDLSQHRRGISPDDVEHLRSAIRRGNVSITLSATVLGETLAMWASNPVGALIELRFALDLSSQLNSVRQVRLVREPGDLVNIDIRAFAAGKDHPRERWVTHDLSGILRDPKSQATRAAAEEFAREHRKQKEAFQASMEEKRRGVMAALKTGKALQDERAREGRRGFSAFFDQHAPDYARALADRAGVLAAVEPRGMAELLKLPSIRMEVGAILSLIYSHVLENRAPDLGDFPDIHHAACASVADVFVTNDGPFAERLRRIPSLPVEVIDLATMLERIGRGPERRVST